MSRPVALAVLEMIPENFMKQSLITSWANPGFMGLPVSFTFELVHDGPAGGHLRLFTVKNTGDAHVLV